MANSVRPKFEANSYGSFPPWSSDRLKSWVNKNRADLAGHQISSKEVFGRTTQKWGKKGAASHSIGFLLVAVGVDADEAEERLLAL